jgi:uncharacterized protein (TIGR02996 family)
MNDGYALLRAIEANPEEDTPRLAYADWLEEHAASESDRARAELIRVQCALAHESPGARKADLAVREHQLLNDYRERWLTAYPVRAPRHAVYVRGFLIPDLNGADFVKHGETLATVAPLNNLWLRHATRTLKDIAQCPALRHVRDLCLEVNALRNLHLPVLLGSPHLTNVRVLGLGNNSIGIAGCEALAATTALPALQILALYGNPIKDRGLEALTGAPWIANLVGLHVSNCGVSAATVIRLAGCSAMSNLRSLDIADLDRDDTTARAVLASPHLAKLVRLWHPDRALSEPVHAALRARFGDKLNLTSYRLDQPEGGLA